MSRKKKIAFGQEEDVSLPPGDSAVVIGEPAPPAKTDGMNGEGLIPVYTRSLEADVGYGSLLRELQHHYLRGVAFYRSEAGGSLPPEEARAAAFHACKDEDEARRLFARMTSKPLDLVDFGELARDARNEQARLYPHDIGDAEIDDAILREALTPFSLDGRDARKVAEHFRLIDADSDRERIATVCLRLYDAGLRSAPRPVALVFAECAVRRRFCHPHEYVAPFYLDGDKARANFPTHGLILPVERTGLVRSLLHYRHAADDAPRWVTSSHLPGGAKAKPSIHVVSPGYAEGRGVAVLVQHALEAEALGRGGAISFVGVNGVSPRALVAQLREQWPSLRGVVMATHDPIPAHVREVRRARLEVGEEGDAYAAR